MISRLITKVRIAYLLHKPPSDWHTPWETEDYVFLATEAAILLAVILVIFSR